MSSLILVFGLLSFTSIAQVAAHGHLSAPLSSDSVRSGSEQDAPVAYPLASDFVCRNDKPLPSSQWTTLTAGQSSSMTWSFQAPHPGDCFAYISYDVNSEDTQKKWFKVGQWRDCNEMNNAPQSFKVPAGLPSCEHCILRWEWYALHLQQVGIVEFYAQCADIKIVGSPSGQLPSPQVTIPGHLPMDAKAYRDPYGNNAATGALIGPPIATAGGAAWSCSSAYGSSCVSIPAVNNPCTISHQRCLTSSTFQSCQVGVGATQWGPSQSCQTGLVCADAGDNAHIFCVNPSTVSPTPSPPVLPPPSPVVYPSTTGAKAVIMPMTTGSKPASNPVTTGRTISIPATTGSRAVSPPVKPSTTGKSISIPSTTGRRISNSTPATTASVPTTIPNQACHLGDQICVGDNQYQTCTNGRTDNYWAPLQKCGSGLTCHPSSTSNNIYCY